MVHRSLARLLALVPTLPLTCQLGCGPEFDPAYLVKNERVLAIRADPPEALPGESVTLTPLVVGPNGALDAEVDYQASWWRCPDEEGDGFADEERCESPDARIELGAGAPFIDVIDPELFPLPDPDAPDEEPNDKLVGAVLGYWRTFGMTMAAESGRYVDAVKRVVVFASPVPLGDIDPRLADLDVRVNDEGEIERNVNPLLTGVEVRKDDPDGGTVVTLEPGGTYWLRPRYDERELQAYQSLQIDLAGLDLDDPSTLGQLSDAELLARFSKVRRCEIPVFSWFVTGGALRRDTTVDERVITGEYAQRGADCPPIEGEARRPEVRFTAPEGADVPDDGVVHAWVILRDGRGGTAYTSFDLTIER